MPEYKIRYGIARSSAPDDYEEHEETVQAEDYYDALEIAYDKSQTLSVSSAEQVEQEEASD